MEGASKEEQESVAYQKQGYPTVRIPAKPLWQRTRLAMKRLVQSLLNGQIGVNAPRPVVGDTGRRPGSAKSPSTHFMMSTRTLVKVLWKWLKNVMTTNVQCGQSGESGRIALPLVVGAKEGNTGNVWITRVDLWIFLIVQDQKVCLKTATPKNVPRGQIGRLGPNVLQPVGVGLEAE